MEDTCEYTVDVPSTVCSTSNEVDIIVTPANRLGLGPPSEPSTIGMTLRPYYNWSKFIETNHF